MTKAECQKAVVEDKSKYRTKQNYAAALDIVKKSYSVDIKCTTGIRYECNLNNSRYFHIIDNRNNDILHDLHEGTVPSLIENLIGHCIKVKVFSLEQINSYVEFFDFGRLNQNYIPTSLTLGAKSLGQNASQIRCIMLNLPFIFYDFKDNEEVLKIWESVTTILEIIRIVHSSDLYEEDLVRLDNAVSKHIQCIKKFFGQHALPKHHNMTHYASNIRHVGPIVHQSTMKYERKHKDFTDIANKTNNFVNIGQTMALKHQQISSIKTNYGDVVNHSKLKSNSLNYSFVCQFYKSTPHVLTMDRLKINSDLYMKKLFLIHDSRLFEINEIFKIEDDFHFLVHQYEIFEHDAFLNSVKIKLFQPTVRSIIKHSYLRVTKSFESKQINENMFIFIDTIEMYRLMILHIK